MAILSFLDMMVKQLEHRCFSQIQTHCMVDISSTNGGSLLKSAMSSYVI